jgi:hypothetical protein
VETIKSTIIGVLQNQKHIRTLTQIWDTAEYSSSSLHTSNKDDHGFYLHSTSAPPPPEPYHSPGKGLVESRLAHRLDPSQWSDCGCSGNLEPCSSHVHLQTNHRSVTCARRWGTTGGRRRWSSYRGRRRGQGSGRVHTHSARGISDNGALVGDDG